MQLPQEVKNILEKLSEAGYEAYVVGGCVRDLLLKKEPKDWDVTTNAKPEEIQKIFPDNVYENTFGTVAIKTGSENPSLAIVEVTPYRIEGKYTDKRHPDEVKFADKLEDDLSRRDFTVNAMALKIKSRKLKVENDYEVIDLFGGQEDLKKKAIRTVGSPEERFNEDALRLLRVIPELREGIDVGQNLHHIYSVWEHLVRSLKYASDKDYSLAVRLASLFHDIGKPRSKRGEGLHSTFYGHEVVGAKMVAQIMERLKFPKDITEQVVKLVRYHMFFYNVGEVTESSVRRLMANVGKDNMEDLIKVREADRIGSGRPKAVPYKLRHMKYIIDKVSNDPISVKMLKIDGNELMKELNIQPGPKVGLILNYLLAEVLDDPTRNTGEYLKKRVHELDKKSPEELSESLKKIEEAQKKEEEERMKKYYV